MVKRIAVVVVCVVVFTFLPWYLFKNHSQERVVRNFLDQVRKHDYQSAYKAWGCGEPRACDGYSYDRFLEDWGEKSPVDPKVLRIEDSESCGSGVMLTVRTSRDRLDTLWVEKSNSVLSFAPPSITVCPTKSFWAMFAHLTLGKLRKPFLN